MTEDQYAAAFLLEAALLIRERGWTQGAEEDPSGRVCIARAMDLGWDRESIDVWEIMRDHVAEAAGLTASVSLPQWNDTPGRTIDEVLDALERAAQLAEAS